MSSEQDVKQDPYTPQEMARVAHAVIRELQLVNGEPNVAPPWDEAHPDGEPADTSQVEYALNGGTAAEQRQEWVRWKLSQGWTYGPVKDAARKTHPDLMPDDELPPRARVKDDAYIAVVRALAGMEAAQ